MVYIITRIMSSYFFLYIQSRADFLQLMVKAQRGENIRDEEDKDKDQDNQTQGTGGFAKQFKSGKPIFHCNMKPILQMRDFCIADTNMVVSKSPC